MASLAPAEGACERFSMAKQPAIKKPKPAAAIVADLPAFRPSQAVACPRLAAHKHTRAVRQVSGGQVLYVCDDCGHTWRAPPAATNGDSR